MSRLLPPQLQKALAERIADTPEIVVPDPYLAQALKAETGYAGFTDIYTWAVKQLHLHKPNPLNLLEAYETALSHIGLSIEGSFADLWEAAQRMGRDWEEMLRGVTSIERAEEFWQALAQHRLIQEAFQLYKGESLPPWLKVLPFPYHSSHYTRTFWEQLSSFIGAYREALRQKSLIFAEEALHRLREQEDNWGNIIFLHIYSLYPSITLLLENARKRDAQIWGWEIQPLETHLQGIWRNYPPLDRAADFEERTRRVTFHYHLTLLETIESAVQAISAYQYTHPEARIAVWCEGESATLLRFFLEMQPALSGKLSPPARSIAESTQVGRDLLTLMKAGLNGQLSTWPPVEGDRNDPAEDWAIRLYETIQAHGRPTAEESWRFLLRLLQSEAPLGDIAFSPDTQIYIGRLTQLAGGRYDALFMIEPPAEPLGRWMRPSYWIAALRRQFSPPEDHHRMAWRLLSLLLWGSGEIYLFRRRDEAYLTPVEEFLRHTQLFATSERFSTSILSSPPTLSLPPTNSIPPQKEKTAWDRVSASLLGQFIVCPRRAWWGQTLEGRSPSEAALIGQLLHDIIAQAFTAKPASKSPKYIPLRRIAYRLSSRRLWYRVGLHRRYGRWRTAYRAMRPFFADTGQPVLHTLLSLGTATPPQVRHKLHWHHLYAHRHIRCKSLVEYTIRHKSIPILGRVDLLIEIKAPNLHTGEIIERRCLLDFKPSVYKEPSKLSDILTALEEAITQLEAGDSYRTPEKFRDVVFQLITYVWMLQQMGVPLDVAALIPLWWRPTTSSEKAPPPYEAYDPQEIKHINDAFEKMLLRLISLSQNSIEETNIPMTLEKRHCTYCDFALLCDRLS